VLGCDWFAGDTTGFLLLVSEVDPTTAASYITTLPAEGYACTAPDADGATMCTMSTPSSEYPVDTVETVIWRDGVWIYSSATNLDGTALLNDLQNSIWVDCRLQGRRAARSRRASRVRPARDPRRALSRRGWCAPRRGAA